MNPQSEIRNPKSCSTTPQERALAIALLQFSETLDRVVADYRPNSSHGLSLRTGDSLQRLSSRIAPC